MENNNEDFNTRLKFDEWQHLSEKHKDFGIAWDTHAFYFNAGIIIVMLYGLDKMVENNIVWYYKLLTLPPILLCGVAIAFLLNTFHCTTLVLNLQQDYIHNPLQTTNIEITKFERRGLLYHCIATWLLRIGGIFAFITLIVGIFVLDLNKKDDNHKVQIINCSMSDYKPSGGFVPGKSFSQQMETKHIPPARSFSQQTVATQQQIKPVTQQPQNTTTTTPQSTPQTANKNQ